MILTAVLSPVFVLSPPSLSIFFNLFEHMALVLSIAKKINVEVMSHLIPCSLYLKKKNQKSTESGTTLNIRSLFAQKHK